MICFIKNGLECNNGEECSMASEQHQNDDSLLVFVTESQVHAFDLSVTFRIAIGRHESSDLQLNSRTVSNYHAEILNENGRIVLRDLAARTVASSMTRKSASKPSKAATASGSAAIC